jgi:hypothetical protein
MTENNTSADGARAAKRFGCLQVFGLMVLVAFIAAGATFFLAKTYLFPSAFKPVVLTPTEEKTLTAKLEGLEPEPYSEKDLKREVAFTERELNGLLAKNTDLADKLVIDLSDDLISAKLRLPMDEDLPILGGQILRLRSGVELSFKDGRPVVILKGVTVMGVPLPNAWLGGIKNTDLVETFGADAGFWKSFSDGIEDVQVEKGLLKVKLKE